MSNTKKRNNFIALLAVYFAANIIFVMSPTFNVLQTEVFPNEPYTRILLISTISSLLMIPGSLVAGALLGKIKYKQMALISMGGIIICGVAPAFVHNLTAIYVFRGVVGFCIGLGFPLQSTMALQLFNDKERPKYLGWATVSPCSTASLSSSWRASFGRSSRRLAAFIDPTVTYSVDKYRTALGAADILSHVIDIRYFIKQHKIAFINEWMESMCRNVIKYAPVAIEDGSNEEARENLSWISALITGGIVDQGGNTDMPLHLMEYGIAAFYEIPHGHGIAVLMPRWMQYILGEETAPVFYHFGVECLGIEKGLPAMEGAQKTIDALSDWLYNRLGLESHLAAMGVDEAMLPEMAKKAVRGMPVVRSLTDLNVQDVENIFRMCM